MAHLSFKSSLSAKKISPELVEVQIPFTPEERDQWIKQIKLTLASEGMEMVCRFPKIEPGLERAQENWTIYFKQKEGENRLYLAHPDLSEWVGTVILVPEYWQHLLDRLQGVQKGEVLDLKETLEAGFYLTSPLSNFNLKLMLAA